MLKKKPAKKADTVLPFQSQSACTELKKNSTPENNTREPVEKDDGKGPLSIDVDKKKEGTAKELKRKHRKEKADNPSIGLENKKNTGPEKETEPATDLHFMEKNPLLKAKEKSSKRKNSPLMQEEVTPKSPSDNDSESSDMGSGCHKNLAITSEELKKIQLKKLPKKGMKIGDMKKNDLGFPEFSTVRYISGRVENYHLQLMALDLAYIEKILSSPPFIRETFIEAFKLKFSNNFFNSSFTQFSPFPELKLLEEKGVGSEKFVKSITKKGSKDYRQLFKLFLSLCVKVPAAIDVKTSNVNFGEFAKMILSDIKLYRKGQDPILFTCEKSLFFEPIHLFVGEKKIGILYKPDDISSYSSNKNEEEKNIPPKIFNKSLNVVLQNLEEQLEKIQPSSSSEEEVILSLTKKFCNILRSDNTQLTEKDSGELIHCIPKITDTLCDKKTNLKDSFKTATTTVSQDTTLQCAQCGKKMGVSESIKCDCSHYLHQKCFFTLLKIFMHKTYDRKLNGLKCKNCHTNVLSFKDEKSGLCCFCSEREGNFECSECKNEKFCQNCLEEKMENSKTISDIICLCKAPIQEKTLQSANKGLYDRLKQKIINPEEKKSEKCEICNKIKDLHKLNCNHSVCENCIKKLMQDGIDQKKRNNICPKCRKSFPAAIFKKVDQTLCEKYSETTATLFNQKTTEKITT